MGGLHPLSRPTAGWGCWEVCSLRLSLESEARRGGRAPTLGQRSNAFCGLSADRTGHGSPQRPHSLSAKRVPGRTSIVGPARVEDLGPQGRRLALRGCPHPDRLTVPSETPPCPHTPCLPSWTVTVPFRPLTMTSELLKHAPRSRCARDGVVRHSLTGHSFLRSFPGERL